MNWLFFVEVVSSGLLAGFITWLCVPAGNPWDLLENFQTSLLAVGIYSGMFMGLVSALPALIVEKRLFKAGGYWISATSVGFAVSMMAAVIYAIFAEIVQENIIVSPGLIRFSWWIIMSLSLSVCFAIIHHSLKIGCRALMGLTPGFLVAGTLLDRFFLIEQKWLLAYLFIGGITGSCLSLAWELLKESWLDEDSGGWLVYRYFIDGPEFIAGGLDECDISIDGAPEHVFVILEKEGLHTLEVIDDKEVIRVNNCRFRYRVLCDGDLITAGNRSFIYHSKLARSRDILPEAAA